MYVSAFFISKVMYTTTEHTSEPVHRTGSGWLFRFLYDGEQRVTIKRFRNKKEEKEAEM